MHRPAGFTGFAPALITPTPNYSQNKLSWCRVVLQFDVRRALACRCLRQTEVCRTFISKLHQYLVSLPRRRRSVTRFQESNNDPLAIAAATEFVVQASSKQPSLMHLSTQKNESMPVQLEKDPNFNQLIVGPRLWAYQVLRETLGERFMDNFGVRIFIDQFLPPGDHSARSGADKSRLRIIFSGV